MESHVERRIERLREEERELWFQRMREMLEEFDCQPTSTEVWVDGVSYYSDWGYGIECIEYFIEALERRYRQTPL